MSDATASDSDRSRQQGETSAEQPQANAAGGASPTAARLGRTSKVGQRRWPALLTPTLRVVALYTLLALASLVLAGATFLLVASPADLIRDRLIVEVHLRTGRDLAVKGGASLKLFPSLCVVMRNVELSAPPGMVSPPTLRAETVTAHVGWWPLQEGRVTVQALTLARPVLDLAVDADGRRNWDFAAIEDRSPPVRLAQLMPRFGHGQGLPPDLYEALEKSVSRNGRERLWPDGAIGKSLQEVRVTDGTIRYNDARTGSKHEMSGIELRIGRDAQGSAQISGSWVLADERIAIEGEAQVREAQPTKLALRVSARPFEASWDGSVTLASASTDLDGRITARASSTAALTRWVGKSPGGDLGIDGPVIVDGRLKASGAAIDLSDAIITLNGATATGSITVDPMRQRPLIKTNLKLSELDLDRYLTFGVPRQDEAPPEPTGAAGSIGDLLRRTEDEGLPSGAPSKARVRGFTRRVGGVWSTESIDPGMLRLVDLIGRFEIDRLSWREIRMEAVRVNATLDSGKLQAEVEDAQLYGGHGKAVLTAHAKGSGAVVGLTASLESVAALPLMQDAARFEWVEGRGRLMLALMTQGANEREMVERLNGRAEFKVTDGAVIGWNVTHMLRKLRQGQMVALERDPEAKTPFSELAGSFTVSNGLAANQDLKMSGPTGQLTGTGSIALPQRTVDYTVRPRLVIATAAHGSATDPLSIEIPVRIQGGWAQPWFTADLQGALNDPRTAETIQQLGRQLRSGNVEEAVKGFFGGGQEGEEKAAKAKEMLKRFLKQ